MFHLPLLGRASLFILIIEEFPFCCRKDEVPEGKVNYYVLPVVHYHEVSK